MLHLLNENMFPKLCLCLSIAIRNNVQLGHGGWEPEQAHACIARVGYWVRQRINCMHYIVVIIVCKVIVTLATVGISGKGMVVNPTLCVC